MQFEWKGIFPALTTKFNYDDTLDLALCEKNIRAQLDAGVHGLILGGSLGEASVLSTAEKETLVKQALELAEGRVPVILNIAEGATRDALQQIHLGHQWRVNGFMLLPPMRYNSDHRETVTYFRTLAQETDLPIMIYNNPVDYKVEVTLDMFAELAEEKNIGAVKESTRNVMNVTRMINRFGERYKILCGVDPLALEELSLGAHGWVAGLVDAFPQETVALYNLVKAGRLKEARDLYRWFMPLLELDIHPKLVQYIKLAESMVDLGSENVRAPRLPLVGEERERISQIIRMALANRPVPADFETIEA